MSAEELGFLADNLASLELRAECRKQIEAARASGSVERLPDGRLALVRDGQVLDFAPAGLSGLDDPALGAVVVFGLGAGNTVRLVRSATRAKVLVFDPDPGLVRTCLERGPADFGDVQLYTSELELARDWNVFQRNETNVVLVTAPGYREAFAERHAALAALVTRLATHSSINKTTYRQRSRNWIRYALENLRHTTRASCFQKLAGVYRGVPAFIVGAGPSLAKNAALLREASQKGLVFATNSSAKVLSRQGVEPQVLMCLESIDVSHLLRDVPFIDRAVRAFSLTAHPRLLETGQGPLGYVFEGLPELSGLQPLLDVAGLAVCGSVSTAAFSLAHRLGCSPIVFVGQDLAYTGDRAYAAGSVYERSRVENEGGKVVISWDQNVIDAHRAAGSKIHESEPLESVCAWGGEGEVPSSPSFGAVRSWLEDAARLLAAVSPEYRLVNATEGGARIAGFEERTLNDVVEDLPLLGETAANVAEKLVAQAPPLAEPVLRAWADGEASRLRALSACARRVRRLAALLVSKVERGRDVGSLMQRIEQAESELRRAAASAPMADAWAFATVDDEARPIAASDSVGEALTSLRQEIEICRAIEAACRELCDELARVGAAPARAA